MISEEEANLARDKYADDLTRIGGHSIGIDEIEHKGKKTFAVVLHTQALTEKAPKYLVVKKGKKTLNVPLKIQISPPFQLE